MSAWRGCARTPQDTNIETFSAALLHDAPPSGWSRALQALWHQGKGDWDRAHQLAQAQDDAEGAWVHAHLHRAEGDIANAKYWYRRAGRAPSTVPLDEEFAAIAAALLARVPRAGRTPMLATNPVEGGLSVLPVCSMHGFTQSDILQTYFSASVFRGDA